MTNGTETFTITFTIQQYMTEDTAICYILFSQEQNTKQHVSHQGTLYNKVTSTKLRQQERELTALKIICRGRGTLKFRA